MEALLISTAVLAAFMLLLRFVAPPLKPRFHIEQRISTQALLDRIAFLKKACTVTERGYGISTRAVKSAIAKNIKMLKYEAFFDASVIVRDVDDVLSKVNARFKHSPRLCLKQGHIGKYPRLFLFCDTIVKNTRGCVTPQLLDKCTAIFALLTENERTELFDVLIFCLAGLMCTALDDYYKRRKDYSSGVIDARSSRIDLDRLRNVDYICGLRAAAGVDFARGLYILADNNGVNIDAAIRVGSVHAAETAEILCSAASALKFALAKDSGVPILSCNVSNTTKIVLQISAVVIAIVSIVLATVFSDALFIAPLIISLIIVYSALVRLLVIFDISGGILPRIPDRFIAVAQGVSVIFLSVLFDPTLCAFAASTVFCEFWADLYLSGVKGTRHSPKNTAAAVRAFVAAPSRIVHFRRRMANVAIQLSYAAVVIALNAVFANASIVYLIGALAVTEPAYDAVAGCITAVSRKLEYRAAVRNFGAESAESIPSREYRNITVSRNDKGKISICRNGNRHELNFTIRSDFGALSLSNSSVFDLVYKHVYHAVNDFLEVSAEIVAPPTHDGCAMRMSIVNRTDKSVSVDTALTCASEFSEEFIGLYVDGEVPDMMGNKILGVKKSARLNAFEKSTFMSVLAFGRMAEHAISVIDSDGYFEAMEAAAYCCRGNGENICNPEREKSIVRGHQPRKNILCNKKICAEISDSGVACGTFPRAYVILKNDVEGGTSVEWSPTLYPCGYNNKVLHYNGFSRFTGEYCGVKCVLDIFAVRENCALAYRLKIKNLTSADMDLSIMFVCELLNNNEPGVMYGANGAAVTIKGDNGFYISSTEKTERAIYRGNSEMPAIRLNTRVVGNAEKTLGFILSRDIISTEQLCIDKFFAETIDYYGATPIKPLTTDKILDYAFNRAVYRIKCEFDDASVCSDVLTALFLCFACKYLDIHRVEERVLEICGNCTTLPPEKSLVLPLVVDDILRFGKNSAILSDGVVGAINICIERAYTHLRGACASKETVNIDSFAGSFRYCVERYRDFITPEKIMRYRKVAPIATMSPLTMLIGFSDINPAYLCAKKFDSGDYDGGYSGLRAMIDGVRDFDGSAVEAVAYFSIMTEMFFGIQQRGDVFRLTPAVALGTPHMEYVLSNDSNNTHIVVADNVADDGSWFVKIGNIVYASNVVTIANYPSPVILFRR